MAPEGREFLLEAWRRGEHFTTDKEYLFGQPIVVFMGRDLRGPVVCYTDTGIAFHGACVALPETLKGHPRVHEVLGHQADMPFTWEVVRVAILAFAMIDGAWHTTPEPLDRWQHILYEPTRAIAVTRLHREENPLAVAVFLSDGTRFPVAKAAYNNYPCFEEISAELCLWLAAKVDAACRLRLRTALLGTHPRKGCALWLPRDVWGMIAGPATRPTTFTHNEALLAVRRDWYGLFSPDPAKRAAALANLILNVE